MIIREIELVHLVMKVLVLECPCVMGILPDVFLNHCHYLFSIKFYVGVDIVYGSSPVGGKLSLVHLIPSKLGLQLDWLSNLGQHIIENIQVRSTHSNSDTSQP